MHLQMDYTTPEGVRYPTCCIVITNIIVMPEQSLICTNWYSSEAAWLAGDLPINQPATQPDTSLFDTGPIFLVSYNHLLTLPTYATAALILDN